MDIYPSILLSTIAERWLDVLANDTAISDFCRSNYGKLHTVFLGIPIKQPPDEKDCPYIIINPGTNHEGNEVDERAYSLSVAWSVIDDQAFVVDGNKVVMPGVKRVDNFGKLIMNALNEASDNVPIGTCDTDLECTLWLPEVIGSATISLMVENNEFITY
jgi:hypothetical protein